MNDVMSEIQTNPRPSRDEALQLALMLQSGMPSSDAIRYFFEPDCPPDRLKFEHDRWMRHEHVQSAILHTMGKQWQDMTLSERIQFAIDKHYSEMAYFLYSTNYSLLTGSDKIKADTCRLSLEAKLAGMAGKMNALQMFWEDMKSGKIKPVGLPA